MALFILNSVNHHKATCGHRVKPKETYLRKRGGESKSFCVKCGKEYLIKRIEKIIKQRKKMKEYAIKLNLIRLKL